MNNIQKLISELEDESIQAEVQYDYSIIYSKHYDAYFFKGYKKACIEHIAKLMLLLNAETQTTVKKPEA